MAPLKVAAPSVATETFPGPRWIVRFRESVPVGFSVPPLRTIWPAPRLSELPKRSVPAVTVVVPVEVFVPDSVRVPAPVLDRPPLPLIAPLRVTSPDTEIAPPPPISPTEFERVVDPVTARVPPPRLTRALPRFVPSATEILPLLMERLLEKVDVPLRVSVPAPFFVRGDDPVKPPEKVTSYPLVLRTPLPTDCTSEL